MIDNDRINYVGRQRSIDIWSRLYLAFGDEAKVDKYFKLMVDMGYLFQSKDILETLSHFIVRHHQGGVGINDIYTLSDRGISTKIWKTGEEKIKFMKRSSKAKQIEIYNRVLEHLDKLYGGAYQEMLDSRWFYKPGHLEYDK